MKKHEYLEIYPSEVAARKISRHLDRMVNDKPRVYRKTLLRYKKLAQLLLECVGKIVRMLQSEMLLSSEDTEFQELVTDFDTAQIDELRNSVDALGDLIDNDPSAENKHIAEDTLKTYKAVFKQASEHDFGYIEVNDCANLLDYWITRRFSGLNLNFKFKTKQLPVWATFVVIAYGKYHALGQSAKFVQDFKKWCDDLDDTSNCWALPFNIFNMTKTVDPSNFTMDAVVIYDILLDGCLCQLVGGKNKIPMDANYIARLMKEYYPNQSRVVRTRFNKQAALIEQLHLVPTTEYAEVIEG